jgi:hypothetical protein
VSKAPVLSPRPLRHVPRQASQLSGMYLPDDFSYDAWRGTCLSGRGDKKSKGEATETDNKFGFRGRMLVSIRTKSSPDIAQHRSEEGICTSKKLYYIRGTQPTS